MLMVGLLALPASAAVIEGRVVDGEEPAAGVRVAAHADLDPGSEPVNTAISDPDGLYRLELPPGRYALFGKSADGRRFAFSGRNPVRLASSDLWIGLQLVPVGEVRRRDYDDAYSAGLEGVVTFGGRPLAGAVVHLYLDTTEGLKGQGYRMSPPTGSDGRFYFDGLPDSDYYLVARWRSNGELVGPVRTGDRIGFFAGNPLHLAAGELVSVALPLVEKQASQGSRETFGEASETRVEGRVVDAQGRPVAGVHVFAYTSRVIGHQRPAALSPPTGDDGRFRLDLPAGGTFYVGARQRYGDSPAPGELFGMFDETADHGLTIAAGEVRRGMRIVVEPVSLE
ncbi:carboxypeptidase family protein [Geothermobacter ehrlichii]|uniref:Carboxypeptidase family protein n=2 Tax=Geothermobacter ehrlichii TaxID=213224 RepID=A0A5D3WG24_9BACT|nr:carboxypeptidase family protein [Geothermobacter ehrlichii]